MERHVGRQNRADQTANIMWPDLIAGAWQDTRLIGKISRSPVAADRIAYINPATETDARIRQVQGADRHNHERGVPEIPGARRPLLQW